MCEILDKLLLLLLLFLFALGDDFIGVVGLLLLLLLLLFLLSLLTLSPFLGILLSRWPELGLSGFFL